MALFRFRLVNSCLRRALHAGSAGNRDYLLERLQVCSGEDQVFEVVGENKAELNVSHVGCAVGMLWRFQSEKPQIAGTVDCFKNHPEFLTLRVLAQNKITLMEDSMLVDMLFNILRLNVDPHDTLVQHLVSEAWLRLDRFPMSSLSKFAVCLHRQNLQHSPLMGQITNILDQKLSTIDDNGILSTLMNSVSSLVSPRLRDALISRAYDLLTQNPSQLSDPMRVLQFLHNIKHSHWPLQEKCSQHLAQRICQLDAEQICIIMGLLKFDFNFDFRRAVKLRLAELIDSSTDPFTFTNLFVALSPMASPEIREGLENTALLLADEFSARQALAVVEALEEINCKNLQLISKIASVVQKNLHVYRPPELVTITQALYRLHYKNPGLFFKLRNILVNFLQNSIFPNEVTMLTHALSMLPCPRDDEGVISRVEAVLPQCSLKDLNTLAVAIGKLMHNANSYHHNTPIKYVRLLQTLNHCGHERLQTTDRLDVVLEELKYISGSRTSPFDELLLKETMVTLQRMMDQINWSNIPRLATFISHTKYLCTTLMDRVACVAIQDIDKIHHSAIYAILLPFAILNYDPPGTDDLFEVCIQHFTPHISSTDPHKLLFLAHALATADCFPEELMREIFNINFLSKLDSQLETLPDTLNMRIRLRLMELNRAVCLECPEFRVPWFHENYRQPFRRKGNRFISDVQKQIHRMLSEVLGGINCVRVAVLTPHFYTVDFECVLDKNYQPVPYIEPNTMQISGKVRWGSDSLEKNRNELPPGARRVAVDFLDSWSFCRNSRHMNGEAMMAKRHLEILGYDVVQIPHFEWNSMELSTEDARKEYLKKKIFSDLPS